MKPVPILLPALLAGWAASAPLSLHPENPNYFLWKEKPAVLITSGEHYGALLNTAFDFRTYFRTLAEDGLNHTRTFSGVYREVPGDFGITDNTLAPKPGHYVAPWARSSEPGESDGGHKFDLQRWDPQYFERLRELMRAAAEHGIVVEFTLFCPMYRDTMWNASPMNARNNINGIRTCGREEVYTLKHPKLTEIQTRFVRKAAEELHEFDNLYFEICNEPYFGGVTDAWQRKMIDVLEKADGKRHLISVNVANGQKKIENPHPAVSIFNFHYCVPPDTVAMNYGLNKVIGENETGFRGRDDVLYRTEAWDFLMAGGALYNNLDYSFTAGHPDGTLRDYTSPGGGSPELRQQLGILVKFMESLDFMDMKPQPGFVSSSTPALTSYALAAPGKSYALYLHTPIAKKPQNLDALLQSNRRATIELDLPNGRYRVAWISPVEPGEPLEVSTLDHAGGQCELRTPVFDDDLALRVTSTP